MSDQNTADNWRLEDTGNTGKQWKLQETEQNRIAQWQLQDESYEDVGWQPVAYEREPRQQGGGWVLPTLVGLALVAVVAYGAWIGLTQFNVSNFSIGSLISNATFTPVATEVGGVTEPIVNAPTAVVATAPIVTTETPVPTATLPPATSPTLAPVLVDQRYVRISNQYGVNARSEPSTAAEIVDLLEVDETFILEQTQAEWLQIAVSNGVLAWISAEFAEQYTEQKPLAEANSERSALGLPLLASPEGDTPIATPVAATTPLTTTAAPVVTTPITTTPTAPTLATGPGATITGTVNITVGLNARSAPEASAALVTLLPGNAELTLTGRTSDNSWLRTTVSESVPVWVFAEFVTVGGDVNTLPTTGGTAPITGTLLTTGTLTELSTTPVVTTTTPSTATTSAPAGATATVNSILGTGVRQGPSRDADALTTLPFDRVYPVLARSADNEWVQIAVEADLQGWVLVSSINLSVDLATLPVVVP